MNTDFLILLSGMSLIAFIFALALLAGLSSTFSVFESQPSLFVEKFRRRICKYRLKFAEYSRKNRHLALQLNIIFAAFFKTIYNKYCF